MLMTNRLPFPVTISQLCRRSGGSPDSFRISTTLEYTPALVSILSDDSSHTNSFVAKYGILSGCVFRGKTREEAMVNIRDAIQGCMLSLEKHGKLGLVLLTK